MNNILGNSPGGGTAVDVITPTKPITLADQMIRDNAAFYDVSGIGFAVEASYQTKGSPAVIISGIFERKPIDVDVFGQVESYALTFRSPNAEVNGARQGSIIVIGRTTHYVTKVGKDSNGDTILTLSQNDYGNSSTPTNR